MQNYSQLIRRALATTSLLAIAVFALGSSALGQDHLTFEGGDGPGKGKHVVFLSGDEEYRSEEAMPMLAQIMARQGFKCTVLFSLNEDGTVNPDAGGNLSHSVAIDSADALVLGLRFRHWDDPSMERFEAALHRGVPMVATRTSTHSFNFPKDSKWAKYSFNAKPETGWQKGFGRQVLGETWVSHHGKHKSEGTRSIVEKANASSPILNGVGTIFVTSDVYGAKPLEPATILLRGEVTATLEPDSPGVDAKNDPMQPVAWTREFNNSAGTTNRILTTTMGAANDLLDESLRRLVINGVYWGLELAVPARADATLPEGYSPSPFSFRAYKEGLKPVDFIPGAPAFKTAKPPEPVDKNKGKKKYGVPKAAQ